MVMRLSTRGGSGVRIDVLFDALFRGEHPIGLTGQKPIEESEKTCAHHRKSNPSGFPVLPIIMLLHARWTAVIAATRVVHPYALRCAVLNGLTATDSRQKPNARCSDWQPSRYLVFPKKGNKHPRSVGKAEENQRPLKPIRILYWNTADLARHPPLNEENCQDHGNQGANQCSKFVWLHFLRRTLEWMRD